MTTRPSAPANLEGQVALVTEALGRRCLALRADVTDRGAVEAAVARTLAELASSMSSFVTGQVLVVDGGVVLD